MYMLVYVDLHVHVQCICVWCRGVEEILKWNPKLINIPRKDGFTPIHLAAIGGHTDVVALLASHVRTCTTLDTQPHVHMYIHPKSHNEYIQTCKVCHNYTIINLPAFCFAYTILRYYMYISLRVHVHIQCIYSVHITQCFVQCNMYVIYM